jgi:DNA helicase HerA-like ATPase
MNPVQSVDFDEIALKGFRLADFNAVALVKSVWDDSVLLAQDLNRTAREKILKRFAEAPELQSEMEWKSNPLIEVYTGVAGAGKTQLLGQIRKEVMASGATFALVDMTGVNAFYRTVCYYLIVSLRQKTPGGPIQVDCVLASLLRLVETRLSEAEALNALSHAAASDFELLLERIAGGLRLRLANDPTLEVQSWKNVLRALMMLALFTGEDRAEAASHWLQGGELDDELAVSLKLPRQLQYSGIIRALTWFMSFRAPVMLAFDQLDVIVNQFETASRGGNTETAAAAKATVIEIAGGLAALWEQACRCQILVSCLQQTWDVLKGNILLSVMDRFRKPPLQLAEISSIETAKRIVEFRLQPAYAKAGFHPAYPTWPFNDSFFEVGLTPRLLIQKCFAHRQACLDAGRVTETGIQTPPPEIKPAPDFFEKLDNAYSNLLPKVQVSALTAADDASEKALADLLTHLCELVLIEIPPPPHIDAKIDLAPGSGNKDKPGLHVRLHLTLLNDNDRDEFFCFRALQHANANAFQARLRAATIDSGVNLKLPFRRLVIARNHPIPSGPKTKDLVKALEADKGRILPLPESELRVILALQSLRAANDPIFPTWLAERKRLRQLSFVREAFEDYFALTVAPEKKPEPKPIEPKKPEPNSPASMVLGKLLGPLETRLIELPFSALTRHVLIRAGSGGGKTVLLKRLIESAALAGIPSIVLDPGNDLAFLGDAWPSPPPAWLPGDPARAALYRENVEVVVWTPGRTAGRPLGFSPLPDFSAVLDDPDDFESAVQMAAGSLSEPAGANKGQTAHLKAGTLSESIRHFARRGGRTLPEFISLLRDLPYEAEGGISQARKLAAGMADSLQASLLTSRTLLPVDGTDFSTLLGIGQKQTRVSVVSLAGLSETNGDRLAFVNQLAVVLFTWIRKNPPREAGQVKGLLVVDEARDFIPSVRSTPCKDSLMRLAAQARKYGFGLLLATQNPTDIDHKAAGQCATQFFGRAASPNVLDAMRRAIEERGGSASDLAQLGKGQFYFSSAESQVHPVRIQAPICLSHHPDGRTLTESEILVRAQRRSGSAD